MKGPGMRLDLDVRRVWQCPACGREIRSDVRAVSKLCTCTREGIAMRLVELPRHRPTVRIPVPPAPDPDIPELADFPTDIPVNPPAKRPPSENSESFTPLEPPDAESTKSE